MASYTKLRDGSWGIRVEGSKPSVGSPVRVTKKDGSTKTEVVAKVLWSGDGVHLCVIEKQDAPTPRSSRSGGYRSSRGGNSRYPRTGCSCGSRDGIIQDTDCFTCRHDAE